jgi:TatD DNase family protein
MDFIDTHCHLDFSDFDNDRQMVIENAKSAGVINIINVGTNIAHSQKSLELSRQYQSIFATVGIHPHEADKVKDGDWQQVEQLLNNDKVVAIGEIGLDYFRNLSSQPRQKEVFLKFLLIAQKHNLPAVIHCRQAQDDAWSILRENSPPRGVVFHCFSGNASFLRKCLDSGFFISFTCNIAYAKAQGLRDLVRLVPLDRIFLETDAPFLPPEGLRGKRCQPEHVALVAREISSIKGIEIEKVASFTTDNARKFFNLP